MCFFTRSESYNDIDCDDLFDKVNDVDKKKIKKKAYTILILNLNDKVLKKVSYQTTTNGVISKLDDFNFKKSLSRMFI